MAAHRRYLEVVRNPPFDSDLIQKQWNIQGIGIHPRLSWRIYIPITWQGKTVSWTTRSIDDKANVRYISASEEEEAIPHKSILYGLDYCHHTVIIVEGPTDVWRIGPGAAALFGTAYTEAQIAKLVKFPYRYVLFDNEPKAQAQARELCEQLSPFPGETHNITIDAKDPGSASRSEIELVRKFAKI